MKQLFGIEFDKLLYHVKRETGTEHRILSMVMDSLQPIESEKCNYCGIPKSSPNYAYHWCNPKPVVGSEKKEEQCTKCNGSNWMSEGAGLGHKSPCSHCNGTGKEPRKEECQKYIDTCNALNDKVLAQEAKLSRYEALLVKVADELECMENDECIHCRICTALAEEKKEFPSISPIEHKYPSRMHKENTSNATHSDSCPCCSEASDDIPEPQEKTTVAYTRCTCPKYPSIAFRDSTLKVSCPVHGKKTEDTNSQDSIHSEKDINKQALKIVLDFVGWYYFWSNIDQPEYKDVAEAAELLKKSLYEDT